MRYQLIGILIAFICTCKSAPSRTGKMGQGSPVDQHLPKSADNELKAVTPEKSKNCVTAFTKKLVTAFQLSRNRLGHFFLK